MRIELISEDIYSFAEVISEYETSVLTVKLRGRTLIGWGLEKFAKLYPLRIIPQRSQILTTQAINIALLLGNWNFRYLIADYLVW